MCSGYKFISTEVKAAATESGYFREGARDQRLEGVDKIEREQNQKVKRSKDQTIKRSKDEKNEGRHSPLQVSLHPK